MLHNINAELGRAEMAKKKFAQKLGVSEPTLRRYIAEETPIPSNILLKMGKILSRSADYLLKSDGKHEVC